VPDYQPPVHHVEPQTLIFDLAKREAHSVERLTTSGPTRTSVRPWAPGRAFAALEITTHTTVTRESCELSGPADVGRVDDDRACSPDTHRPDEPCRSIPPLTTK
jgi:hypothetical protein